MHVEVRNQLFGVGALPCFSKQQTGVASYQTAVVSTLTYSLSHFSSLFGFFFNIFLIFTMYLCVWVCAHTYHSPFVEGIE